MHPGVQEHASNEPHTAPLLSVFGGQRLHPTVWKPAGDAKLVPYSQLRSAVVNVR